MCVAAAVLGLAALASLVLSFLALFAVSFLMPFYFENLRALPPDQSGLLLTPLSLAIAIVAPVSGSLADRLGSRWLASAGIALTWPSCGAWASWDSARASFSRPTTER